MATPGDKYASYLNNASNIATNPDMKKDYIWGADGNNADHSASGDPEWDCSGLRHAALVAAGYKDSRTTAEGYRKRGVPIKAPSQVGDCGFLLLANGTAHHIIEYEGGSRTVEAKGAAWGIVRGTVASANARGAKWYRDAKVNAFLAQSTSPAPAPKPATAPVVPAPATKSAAPVPAPVVAPEPATVPVAPAKVAPRLFTVTYAAGVHVKASARVLSRTLVTIPHGGKLNDLGVSSGSYRKVSVTHNGGTYTGWVLTARIK